MKRITDDPVYLMNRIKVERDTAIFSDSIPEGMIQHVYHILGERLTRSPRKAEFDAVLDTIIAELMQYKISQQS